MPTKPKRKARTEQRAKPPSKKTSKKKARATGGAGAKAAPKKPAVDSATLQARNAKLTARVRSLESALDEQKKERERLSEQLATIEAESKRYFDQYVDVEMQNSNVANLYVASLRLHSTLDRNDVLAAIQEIVINLIGSEELGIFELERGASGHLALELVASFGVDARLLREAGSAAGIIGRCVATGEMYVATATHAGDASDVAADRPPTRVPGEAHMTACVPLVVDGRVTGAVAIFRLLEHKRGLEDIDSELFSLLGTQAATALYCTRLVSAAQRLS